MADGKIHRLRIQSFIATLMLVVYTTGTIGIDLLHHSLHDHGDHLMLAVKAETDPCYRSIHYAATESGCEHKAHITEAEKCKFSHVVFYSHQLLTHPTTIEPSFEDHYIPSSYLFCAVKTIGYAQSLRGPPAV